MIVRKITPQEFLQAEEIGNIAFEFSAKKTTLEERLKQIKESPSSRPDHYSLCRWAAFDDDGTMMGSISTYPYQIRFDGKSVGMSGIGFVSTLPGYRRRGAIRGCFEQAFREMKELGQVFSALYPFSVEYYRQFGYELTPQTVEWTVPLSSIPNYEGKGSYHLYRPGEDLSDYHLIYRDFVSGYNLAAIREDLDFSPFTLDPVESKAYWYLYRNEKGVPKGYLRFYKETVDKERRMDCGTPFRGVEFCFRDIEGLKGLLSFVKSFAANYDSLVLSLPADIPLELFLGEANGITRKISFAGLYRVVDAVPVLMAAAYRGDGALSIEIADKSAPWNEGVFTVEFQDGKAIRAEKTEAAPQISMGIEDFTRLISGCYEGQEIRLMPHVTIHQETSAIDQIFYRKPIWLHDFF